jgi:hypothetical protein
MVTSGVETRRADLNFATRGESGIVDFGVADFVIVVSCSIRRPVIGCADLMIIPTQLVVVNQSE